MLPYLQSSTSLVPRSPMSSRPYTWWPGKRRSSTPTNYMTFDPLVLEDLEYLDLPEDRQDPEVPATPSGFQPSSRLHQLLFGHLYLCCRLHPDPLLDHLRNNFRMKKISIMLPTPQFPLTFVSFFLPVSFFSIHHFKSCSTNSFHDDCNFQGLYNSRWGGGTNV